ncbi:MAG TPA: methionyl-tRNA formyltransferase [Candidatus Saccharimonadales bacterium]|nr:methionyl-tRNA formyltransferase [Candidatus Saccharimonadales bacterium]
MKNTSKKIVFFGNERLSSGFEPHGAPTLTALIKAGYTVIAVVANHQAATSRKARKLEVQEVAETYDIPVLLPKKLGDIHDELIAKKPDIGVLVAYGRMVPRAIIDIFPYGIINIHPSLLPLYRGSTPIEQAILDGAQQTGVSLMQLVQKMDAGPIFAQKTIALNGHETKQELTSTLLQNGGQMLLETLPHILQGSIRPSEQNEALATYCGLISKQESVLNLSEPAVRLEREIRAYAAWPKSRLTIFGQEVIITKARIAQSPSEAGLVLACGQKSYLTILELIAPSGRRISGEDFVRGYKKT